MQAKFIAAIHSKQKIQLTFYSKEDHGLLVRTCAPMDFGPSRRASDKSDRFHFWDYDSDTQRHTLSLLPDQVHSIELIDEKFDPAEFITWDTSKSPWFVKRSWGQYS
jgi:hypothetical protein